MDFIILILRSRYKLKFIKKIKIKTKSVKAVNEH